MSNKEKTYKGPKNKKKGFVMKDEGEKKGSFSIPEIDFSTFIISFQSSALVALGIMADPTTNTKTRNLPLAKQTIDILGMLEKKTRGNLTDEEFNLLTNFLHDLRMMYVKETG